jgi:hypothetical protein
MTQRLRHITGTAETVQQHQVLQNQDSTALSEAAMEMAAAVGFAPVLPG